MRRAATILLAAAALTAAAADDPKPPVTHTGKLVCGKCVLGETTACSNALVVAAGGRTVTYFLADKGSKEPYHKCSGERPKVTVTGTVEEKNGRPTLTPTKVE